jgi:spermidine synthase
MHNNLAFALMQQGRIEEATQHYEQALRLKPDYPEAQNGLARLLAMLGPAEGGDPIRAVTLAERACELTGNSNANFLDTLAVAYAAAGRFNDAIATAQKAIELARSAGQSQLVAEIETRLQLYRGGQSYHQLPTPVRSQSGVEGSPQNP